jgi:hypothetical protein
MVELTKPESALAEAVVAFAMDPESEVWADPKTGALFVDADFGRGRRRLAFGDVATHGLGECCDGEERRKAIAGLLAGVESWPPGLAEIRCVSDVFVPARMETYTDIVAFVDDKPVSAMLRITTPMRESA